MTPEDDCLETGERLPEARAPLLPRLQCACDSGLIQILLRRESHLEMAVFVRSAEIPPIHKKNEAPAKWVKIDIFKSLEMNQRLEAPLEYVYSRKCQSLSKNSRLCDVETHPNARPPLFHS